MLQTTKYPRWRNIMETQSILLILDGFLLQRSSHTEFDVSCVHDDVMNWKHFPRYWLFVRGINRGPVNSLHKGQWRGALMFSLICAWIYRWVNNGEAGDFSRYRAHYDVIVMHLPELQTAETPCHSCNATLICYLHDSTHMAMVIWGFDILFVVRLNKLSKRSPSVGGLRRSYISAMLDVLQTFNHVANNVFRMWIKVAIFGKFRQNIYLFVAMSKYPVQHECTVECGK